MTALAGRRAVVTGGASGIGLATVRALAGAGVHTLVVARHRERAEEATAGLPHVTVAEADLASVTSVRALTTSIDADRRPIHLLIANAGVMGAPPGRTADGFETHLGVNHLGHFALVTGLLDSLRRARGARVVVVSSSAHLGQDLDFTDPHFDHRPYDAYAAYGQSKTANALFAAGLDARERHEGIRANAVSPGAALTRLQRHMPHEQQVAVGLIDDAGTPNPRLSTPEQAAATTLWAATAAELADVGGAYLEDCAVAGPWSPGGPPRGHAPHALDPERADRLWKLSEASWG